MADRLNDLLQRQARLDNLETNLQAQAAAAASVAASGAVGREMLEIGTRLGRIEAALAEPSQKRLPSAD